MKKHFFFLLFALVASLGSLFASETQVDGIWYDSDSSSKTASVTYRGSSYYFYSNRYSGAVVIPASVTYNNEEYNVTSIGGWAFAFCSGLTSIEIPNSVTSIGNDAFAYCRSLTSVTIPNSVTSIGDDAFYNCTGLTSVTIPNSVTSIGNYAFSGCSGLTSVTIPNSVTSIGGSAFSGCTGLTSVTIPNSVTSIGNYAFSGCSGLTSPVYNAHVFAYLPTSYSGAYIIPDGIESIAGSAFEGCSGLTSIEIPNSVTSIGGWAFYGCTGLTSIEIPNSVTSIGGWAFYGCTGLTSVIWNAKNYADFASNNTPFYSDYYDQEMYQDFRFDLRPQITAFTFGNEVEHIPANLCNGMSNLTSVTIPNSVTSIGGSAFYNCTGLTSVTIPNSVTSIGGSAFSGCTGLTSVIVENGNTVYDSRDNCNAIIETATNTLIQGCKNTTIPNSVTSIGYAAFLECSGLTSVTIGNSVTSIGSGAFGDCRGLTSVTIGKGVTSIGEDAFYDCSGLTSVTNYATTPQSINSHVFYNVNKSTCTLYVPAESVDAYKAAEGWKDFENIVGVDVPGEDPDMPSSTPAVYTNPANPAQKLIRNGNVYILTGDNTYTLTGQKVK